MSPRHTETRQRAIEVALELFAAQGYEKTSLREIADRLGITKAALYYHFASKEALLGAIIESVLAPIDAAAHLRDTAGGAAAIGRAPRRSVERVDPLRPGEPASAARAP
jgi:AcrR family transcriptional regulator